MLGLALMASFSVMSYAQTKGNKGNHEQHPSFEEFMAQRTHFFIQEMKLNNTDSAKFVVVYQQLMKDKGELMRKYHPGRDMWRKLRQGEALPDTTYLRLVENDAKLELEDAQLELSYVERFSKILTPRQLFDYRQAEKKFRSNFMKRDHKPGDKNGAKGGAKKK